MRAQFPHSTFLYIFVAFFRQIVITEKQEKNCQISKVEINDFRTSSYLRRH